MISWGFPRAYLINNVFNLWSSVAAEDEGTCGDINIEEWGRWGFIYMLRWADDVEFE